MGKKDNSKPRRHHKAVVKISGLPHGFYEEQLKDYFNQFGLVTNVKVSRSEKTGRSKGIAFVEFMLPEVAQIAAETMNNYLMFKSVMKTTYIAPEMVKGNLFKNRVNISTLDDGRQVVRSRLNANIKNEVKKHNKKTKEGVAEKRIDRAAAKLSRKSSYLKKMGLNFDVNAVIVNAGEKSAVINENNRKTDALSKKKANKTTKKAFKLDKAIKLAEAPKPPQKALQVVDKVPKLKADKPPKPIKAPKIEKTLKTENVPKNKKVPKKPTVTPESPISETKKIKQKNKKLAPVVENKVATVSAVPKQKKIDPAKPTIAVKNVKSAKTTPVPKVKVESAKPMAQVGEVKPKKKKIEKLAIKPQLPSSPPKKLKVKPGKPVKAADKVAVKKAVNGIEKKKALKLTPTKTVKTKKTKKI